MSDEAVIAILAHLATVVVGLGGVVVSDWMALKWVLRRVPLVEVARTVGHFHALIWTGVAGSVTTGILLGPDLASSLTLTKLGAVVVLVANGWLAGLLGRRMARPEVSRRLLIYGGASAVVSQTCWWTAFVLGFLSTQ